MPLLWSVMVVLSPSFCNVVLPASVAAEGVLQGTMLHQSTLADKPDHVIKSTDVFCYSGSDERASEVHEPNICMHA